MRRSTHEFHTFIETDGGEIRVRNMSEEGCVFTIDLPRLAVAPSGKEP